MPLKGQRPFNNGQQERVFFFEEIGLCVQNKLIVVGSIANLLGCPTNKCGVIEYMVLFNVSK